MTTCIIKFFNHLSLPVVIICYTFIIFIVSKFKDRFFSDNWIFSFNIIVGVTAWIYSRIYPPNSFDSAMAFLYVFLIFIILILELFNRFKTNRFRSDHITYNSSSQFSLERICLLILVILVLVQWS